jgi:MFS transporter, YNFM family, putative membrane transport protein
MSEARSARTSALWALCAVHFGSSAMMRACDPMLPALARYFDVGTGRAAFTISAYAVAYGLMQLFFGPLGDRFGKRRMIGFAALGCVVGNVLALCATSLEMLIVARFAAGASAAGIIALVLAWVGDSVSYEDRQAVLARFLMLSLAGMIAGQWVSAFLTEHFGWRSVFAVLGCLFLVGGLAISRNPEVRAEPVRPPSPRGHLHDLRQVVEEPWARWVLVVVLVEGAFAFSGLAFLPAFLVREFGLGLASAAAIVALYGIGGFFYVFAARPLLRRCGESGIALTGGLAMGLAWILLAIGDSWMLALPASLVGGLGFYMLHGTLQTHATQMVPALRGTAVSLFAMTLFLGISIGVAVASELVDRIGSRPVFMGCGLALAVLGAIFALSLRRRQEPRAATPAG